MDRLEYGRKLRKMLAQISPESRLENLSQTFQDNAEPQLQVGGDRDTDEAVAALDVLVEGEVPDVDQQYVLEAIVLPRFRPVIDIINDKMKITDLTSLWKHFGNGPVKNKLETAIPLVGRIEIPDDPGGRLYAGTGFVVGPNLIMTNRHVAEIFATGLGRRNLRFRPARTVDVDFKREINSEESRRLSIQEVVVIHPYWDMALLRVKGLPAGHDTLKLTTTHPEDLRKLPQVAVLGYPAIDDRNDLNMQFRIFRGTFNVKRLQPGNLLEHQLVESFGRQVLAITHDCSTLGGNSGSAVIHVDTGDVVALHFGGVHLEANFAVPAIDLAADPRVVDAGVKFTGTVAPADIYPPLWQLADQTESPAMPERPGIGPVLAQPGPAPAVKAQPVIANPTTTTWTVPLQITVSVGVPVSSVASQTSFASPLAPAPGPLTEGLFGRSAPTAEIESAASFSTASLNGNDFSWQSALSTALASRLSYEQPGAVERTALDLWNFKSCNFFEAGETQCFVATTPDIVLVAFRGTAQLRDWLANLNLFNLKQPYGAVHRGFYHGFLDVKTMIQQSIGDHAGKKIILTGHSLGGALATIAAAEWQGLLPIHQIYTFGQPCVGKAEFSVFMFQHYPAAFFRFVNDDDIVPRVPPTYRHVGKLYHFDASGDLVSGLTESVGAIVGGGTRIMTQAEFDLLQMQLRHEQLIATRPLTESSVPITEGFFPSVRDHSLDLYIAKIAGKLV